MRVTEENSFWKRLFGIFILLILVTGCAGQPPSNPQEKKEIRERADQSQRNLEEEETKKE